jgi:hypothetical protein
MPAKIKLSEEQVKTIKTNYGLMTNTELAKLINSSVHTVSKYVQLLNIEQHENPRKLHNFNDGNGFFDVDKYRKVVF